MSMTDDRKSTLKHKILIEQREKLSVTGVTDVISFDEECVVAETDFGVIIFKGVNLHVNNLNVDSGELSLDGEIDSVNYEDTARAGSGKGRKSFFGKIFK